MRMTTSELLKQLKSNLDVTSLVFYWQYWISVSVLVSRAQNWAIEVFYNIRLFVHETGSRKICIAAKVKLSIHIPAVWTHLNFSVCGKSGKRRPWSDCANAQADLSLCISLVLLGTFSCGVPHTNLISEKRKKSCRFFMSNVIKMNDKHKQKVHLGGHKSLTICHRNT